MATQQQRDAVTQNVQRTQQAARDERAISHLALAMRSALGRDAAKAAARKRGANTAGAGTGAGRLTVTQLRREAARMGIGGRSQMGKAQLIRAVGQKRRFAPGE